MMDMVGGDAARVLLAVAGGAATMREVSEQTGIALTTTALHLNVLRRIGLVGWTRRRHRTLRPLVRVEWLGDSHA